MALIIDPTALSAETLTALIEDHITKGADMYQGNLAEDTKRVRSLVLKGELKIQYSEEFEVVSIIAPPQ